jgi:hypothetical protein
MVFIANSLLLVNGRGGRSNDARELVEFSGHRLSAPDHPCRLPANGFDGIAE